MGGKVLVLAEYGKKIDALLEFLHVVLSLFDEISDEVPDCLDVLHILSVFL
jgi:hypothetical protein